MIQNRTFLKTLFESQSAKKSNAILINASIEEVNILLQILYSITQGDIPIKRKNYELLKKSKKLVYLHRQFESISKLNDIISKDLKAKLIILLKCTSILSILLQSLFLL